MVALALAIGAGGGLLALAAPGDWRVILRNDDDSADTQQEVSQRATSTPAVLGGGINSDTARWYYFGNGFTINGAPTPLGISNYQISLDLSGYSPMDVGNLSDLLDAKESIIAHNASIAGLQSQINTMSTTSSQVQSDWLQASTTVASYIKDKPVLGAVATTSSYTDLVNKPTIGKAIEATTTRSNSFPIFKSSTVGSGVAVFYLTADNTSGGTSVCPNGVIKDSASPFVGDATASFQMSAPVFTNSDKTVTITTNKLTTANILTGVLGQSTGNGSVVKLTVWCY